MEEATENGKELSHFTHANGMNNNNYYLFIIFSGCAAQREVWPPPLTRFLDHTRHATVGRTPLDE
jgi:hypothetical protein